MEADDLAESWLAVGAHEVAKGMKSVYHLEQRALKDKEEHVLRGCQHCATAVKAHSANERTVQQ
jgi:hypothetical protein